jgi:hypothetical protein
VSRPSAETCLDLKKYLEGLIEEEEGMAWEGQDMQEGIRDHLIKERDINIMRLNQLLDMVHAHDQET